MKNILISVGPIHGKLDSVKIITNKFKGGLAALTAKELAKKRPKDLITVVKCNETVFYKSKEKDIKNIKIVNVEDFFDYEKFVLNNKFDAYILAAAVANLIPKNSLKGKFPSHNFKEGEKVNIPFVITRRVIMHIKEKFPRSTLIGYKLFDGSNEELIKAGWDLLVETKSNAIFCNNPKTAKEKKICLLPDGSKIELDFYEHINFINRIIDLQWYKTKILNSKKPLFENSDDFIRILDKTTEKFPPYMFGCVAFKSGEGFYTTVRGKKEIQKNFAYLYKVDHKNKIVYADKKATLNAPLLDLIFSITNSKVIVHSHKKLNSESLEYIFSGTNEEFDIKEKIKKIHNKGENSFNVKFHGYYSWFNNFYEAEMFVDGKEIKMKGVDWNNYNELFPDRYLNKSNFDIFVNKEIKSLSSRSKRKINLLEIGSNKKIRYLDKKFVNNYYILDKFVKVKNKDVKQIGEKDLQKIDVDLIIIRGTFNYLNKIEIINIKKIILKNKCKLIFNTFNSPSSVNRQYINKNSKGLEISDYDKKNKIINHYLYPKGKNYYIKHSFFYYDNKEIKELFKGLKFNQMKEGNSLCISVNV